MDAVQVELEDLVLGEALLERHRQDRLLHLAAAGAVVGEKDIAGELLGDGRSALYPAAAVDADLERASDADRVAAGVRPKAPVLDRDHRPAHARRNHRAAHPSSQARAPTT